MKTLYILLTIFFLTIASNTSYAQAWQWAASAGTSNNDQAGAMAIDVNENVYAIGYYQSTTISFGAITLNSTQTPNYYIVKYNKNGTALWAQNILCNNTTIMSAVTTNTNGYSYVCGMFSGTTLSSGVRTVNHISAGTNYDMFVACYDPNGNCQWIKNWASTSNLSLNDAYYSASDNSLYMTGSHTGTLNISPLATLNNSSTSANDGFVAKFAVTSGTINPIWAIKTGGANADDIGSCIRVDKKSNVYVAGSFSPATGTVSTIASFNVSTKGGKDLFLARYDLNGSPVGVYAFGTTNSNEYVYDMAIDTAGSVYLGGSFLGNDLLLPTLFGTNTLTIVGSNDGFVAKFGPISNGFLLGWAKNISGTSTSNDAVKGLGADANGNIYVGGSYTGSSITIGAQTYTNTSPAGNCYITKISSGGSYLWSLATSGNGSPFMADIESTPNGDVYGCGTVYVSAPLSFGTTTLTSLGGNDVMVFKEACVTPTISTTNPSYTLCASQTNSTTVAVNSSQSDVTYSWSIVGASGVNLSSSTGTSVVVSYTASNSFSIIVTGTNACSNVSVTAGSVLVNPLPNIGATASPTAVCTGNSLVLTGSGATSYTWSNGVSNGVPFTVNSSNTYTVTGTNANNCMNTYTITVNALSHPTLSVLGNTLVCLNASETYTANGASTYTWSPNNVVGNTLNIVTNTTTTTYTVNGTGSNGCKGKKVFTLNIVTPVTPDICEVTVDSLSNYNEIYWDKTLYNNVDSFIVYRETTIGNYSRIAALSYTALSMYVDTNRHIGTINGNPNISHNRYQLQILDSCGNYSARSPYHSTIFIQDQYNGNFNLADYAIEGTTLTPVTAYTLKRRDTGTGIDAVIGSSGGISVTDPSYFSYNSFPQYTWFVDAQGFNCNATFKTNALKNRTKSNHANDRLATGLSKNQLLNNNITVYPNPANENLMIDLNELKGEVTIVIKNLVGETLMSETTNLNKTSLNVAQLPKGIYFITVSQSNKTIAIKKIVKD